jgi:hypothetical protein
MTVVSKGSALSALPHVKSGIIAQQLNRWIGSIFQRVGAWLMNALLRLKSMHELNRLSEPMLREIGLTRVNLPGATPGLHGETTGRFVWRSSLKPNRICIAKHRLPTSAVKPIAAARMSRDRPRALPGIVRGFASDDRPAIGAHFSAAGRAASRGGGY